MKLLSLNPFLYESTVNTVHLDSPNRARYKALVKEKSACYFYCSDEHLAEIVLNYSTLSDAEREVCRLHLVR